MCEPDFACGACRCGGIMTPDDLDRLLLSEDLLEPSSGFASNVMDAVRRQATEPLPLPFPRFRFAVGLAGCSVMAGAGTALLQSETVAAVTSPLVLRLVAVAPELG